MILLPTTKLSFEEHALTLKTKYRDKRAARQICISYFSCRPFRRIRSRPQRSGVPIQAIHNVHDRLVSFVGVVTDSPTKVRHTVTDHRRHLSLQANEPPLIATANVPPPDSLTLAPRMALCFIGLSEFRLGPQPIVRYSRSQATDRASDHVFPLRLWSNGNAVRSTAWTRQNLVEASAFSCHQLSRDTVKGYTSISFNAKYSRVALIAAS